MKIEEQFGSPDERYSYRSPLVDALRKGGREQKSGRITIRLAEKLGFCWGVDRAVAMVSDALRRNPGRRLWLLNQIIHNPKVNEDFQKNGVRFVFGRYAEPGGFDRVRREDLVIIPAFSAEVEHLQQMQRIGCEVVDTTCPWVEKPHRRVVKYIEDGFTTLIHGQPGPRPRARRHGEPDHDARQRIARGRRTRRRGDPRPRRQACRRRELP
jgi:4-hydroxy-3-methylbut-2-enyl diphosphate reductase